MPFTPTESVREDARSTRSRGTNISKTTPRPRARTTGAVYLLYFVTAIFAALLVARGFVVYGEAANLIANAFYIAVTLLFYRMFTPVNKSLSLFAALLSLTGCGLQTLALFHLAPSNLSPFLFFGPYCILIGYLIFRSTFLPRMLGAFMALAGLGWLMVLSPPLATHLSSYIKVVGILAEGSLMLWLLGVGVNAQKWNARTRRASRA